jgi:SAM-dependent methyltransferase
MTLLPRCICGTEGAIGRMQHGLPVLECKNCGMLRQDVSMTPEQYAAWYAQQYYAGVYAHTITQDTRAAVFRLSKYGLPRGTKLLDVGTGNGEFVRVARSDFGIDAWGQDVARQSDAAHVYVGALEDVAFPTASFDVATVHDVLEHVPDPLTFLREIKRTLVDGGRIIVDFPRFHSEHGRHHWKPVEHLWLWNEDQLLRVLRDAGFQIEETYYPIPSKFVAVAGVPIRNRKRIMVPSGIGDAYWVMVKLPGFLHEHGIVTEPTIVVQDSGGPKRTQPYIRNLPMVHDGGYKWMPTGTSIFHEAYMQNRRTVFPQPFADVDWFIAYNGVMRAGRSLDEVDPQYVPRWRPRLHVSKEARAFREELAKDGPYCLVYFAEAGMYKRWLNEFRPQTIVETLTLIQRTFGVRIVFLGAAWDRGLVGQDIARANAGDPEWVDLIGQTTFDQMLGAIDGAWGVFGFPAGNTILAAVRNVPTVLVWHNYFRPEFWVHACPPDAPYIALDSNGLMPDAVVLALRGARQKLRDLLDIGGEKCAAAM